MLCDRCYKPADEGEHGLYRCPLEPRGRSTVVWQDTIEGGLEIAHGLCNPDGTPRTYYSRSEIRMAAQVKGLIPWSDVYSEDRTKDARVREDWKSSSEAQRARRDRVERRMDGERRTTTQPGPVQMRRPASESTKRITADVLRSLT